MARKDAIVQGQLWSNLPTFLDIGAVELGPGIEELTRSLGKFLDIAKEKTGDRIIRVVRIKSKVARLPVEIIHIHFGYFAVIPKGNVVVAPRNMQVVGQSVVGSAEKALRIVSNAEVTGRRDRINLFESGLPDVHP
jgi:hypothetical protein